MIKRKIYAPIKYYLNGGAPTMREQCFEYIKENDSENIKEGENR